MVQKIVCSRCKKEKDETAFTRSKSGKYGRHHMCRVCLTEAQDAYTARVREYNLEHGPAMTGTQQCRICKKEKPLTEFPVRMDRKGGRTSQCSDCMAESQAVRREQYRKRASGRGPAMTGMKRCPRCEQEKPVTEFPTNPNTADGRQRLCSVCYTERQHEYYLARKARSRQQ